MDEKKYEMIITELPAECPCGDCKFFKRNRVFNRRRGTCLHPVYSRPKPNAFHPHVSTPGCFNEYFERMNDYKKTVFLDIDKTITSKDFFHGVKYKGKEFYKTLANDVVPDRMKKIVFGFLSIGFKIQVFTGRDLDYKKCTEKFWKNNFPQIKTEIVFCGENSDTFNYDNYVALKAEKMIRHIIKNKCKTVVVVDDDHGIIKAMKENVLGVDLRCYKMPEDIENCERFVETGRSR